MTVGVPNATNVLMQSQLSYKLNKVCHTYLHFPDSKLTVSMKDLEILQDYSWCKKSAL